MAAVTTVDEAFADVQRLFADPPVCEAHVHATRVCDALARYFADGSEESWQRVVRVHRVWGRYANAQTR